MQPLKQALEALSQRDVRGIASRLALRQRGQHRKGLWIDAIAQLWHEPGQRQSWLQQLSAQAQTALRRLIAVEQMPAAWFEAEYGAIRRASERQQWSPPPWQQPATPSEELYYVGLLHRLAPTPPLGCPQFYLPTDVRPLLHTELARLATTIAPQQPALAVAVEPPDWALCHDIGQLLIYLHQQTVSPDRPALIRSGHWLTPAHLRRLNQRLWQPDGEPLARSHKQTARNRLLMFLATAAGLLHAGALTPLAWAWLGEPAPQQLEGLWRGWQDASADLRQTYAQPDASLPAPWPAPLLAALRNLPQVFGVAEITAHLLASGPAQPTDWVAQTDWVPQTYWVAHLSTLSELDQLVAATLTDVLAVLGVVKSVNGAPGCLQLTAVGQWLLEPGHQAPPSAPASRQPAQLDVHAAHWRLTAPATALLAQAQLAPYAAYATLVRQPVGGPAHLYQLDAATIGRAAALGLGLPNLLDALAGLGIPLTPAAWQQLQAWHQGEHALHLGSYALLRTASATQMQALHQVETVRPLLGELLSPTTALLNTGVAEMMQALDAAGCYALVLPNPGDALPPATGALWLAGQVYALLGQQLALPLPPPFAALQTLFSQLSEPQQALLQNQLAHLQERLLDLLDHLSFTPPPQPSDPTQWQPLLEAAIRAKRNLSMDYFSAGRNLPTRRLVEPYWIEERYGVPYLVAYCHQAGRVLTFRLDRIQALTGEG